MTANDIPNGILAGLTKVANLFAQKMKQRLSSGNYPGGNSERGTTSIQDATSVGTAQQAGDISFIDVNISLAQAPFAAAFEWGSGVHKQRGVAGRYRIDPRNSRLLAFKFTDAASIGSIPLTKDGKAILPYVMHPGITPKPYIAPTLIDNKEEFRKIMGQELKAAIMLGVPPVTVIEVKL